MNEIAIGKIRTSTGVQGYFKVHSFSGEVAHFKKLKGQSVALRQNGREKNLLIEDVRMSGSSLTLKAVGIDSPEEAKKLTGWEFYVERKEAAVLGEGEFYLIDLCKCSLVMNGTLIGKVKGVSDNGVSDLIEVEFEGKTRLIPFLEQFVGDVDLEAGTIELKESWLLE